MPIINKIKHFLSRDEHVLILLCTAAALTYFLCLPNEMFWDDQDFILKNIYIQDWHFWTKFFTENIIAGTHLVSNYWRPLLQGIFAVQWHLWADWAYGWHAVSIACHAMAGILLFFMVNALLKQRPLAIITALLWLVHPVHTEAVVYPNSLGDSLTLIFILAGIYFYTRFRNSNSPMFKSRDWWLALLMYPLALLSKETGILLVAFIAAADLLILKPVTLKPVTHTQLNNNLVCVTVFKAIWPFILIAITYLVLRATVLNFSNSFNFYNQATPFTTHFLIRLWAFFRVMALYAGFIFTPWDLRVERLIDPPVSFLTPDVLWGAALCLGLAYLAVRYWNKRPAVTFGITWFFIAILPTSNLIVIINALVYEHFLYIALIGILISLLSLGMSWANDARKRRIFLSMIISIIIIFAIRSAWRCTDWRTAIGFYEQLLPTAPKSYRVINNLGMAYAENGMLQKAEETYNKAIALDPSNAVAYHNLANIYRDTGRQELARTAYEKAIALQRNFVFTYKSLTQIYLDRKEYKRARQLLEIYYDLADEKIYTLNILAEIAYREGALDDAKRYLKVLLQLTPHDPAVMAALDKLNSQIKP